MPTLAPIVFTITLAVAAGVGMMTTPTSDMLTRATTTDGAIES
jgi:hypothetical protein